MHVPVVSSHARGAWQVAPPHALHAGKHTPWTQTLPVAQATRAQRSTHELPIHTWPCGHTTPSQAVAQTPARHTWAEGQVTPTHFGSMQTPLVGSHTRPGSQGFSRLAQRRTQTPSTHTSDAIGQVAPLSTVPSQSSSTPLQTSGAGAVTGWHVGAALPPTHAEIPSAHAPCSPVEQGRPAPLHCTPSTATTRSVKSALVVSNVSSHAK